MNTMSRIVAGGIVALTAAASHAQINIWNISMSGAVENPVNASPGIGSATITTNTTLNTLRIQASFSGLTGTTTAAHIHAAASMVPFTGVAGVAVHTPSLTGFPLGVTNGTYDNTFDMTLASSYTSGFITANGGTTASAFAALINYFNQGRAYLNLHTSTFGGGEIRGVLPTPGAAAVLAMGGLVVGRRRR